MAKTQSNQKDLQEFPLIEHITEFKHRVIISLIFFIISFIFCYSFHNEIYNVITMPLVKILEKYHLHSSFIYTKLIENFTSTLSLVFSVATFMSIPFWVIQIWLFILPALYEHEQKKVLFIIVSIPLFFILGVLFCYFFVLPSVFDFFISFASSNIRTSPPVLQARITEYIDMSISLLYTFGVAFLFPIVLIILNYFGIVSTYLLKQNRKYAIILIFIISAVLTPPDIISQIILAIPLILMYELVILTGKLNTKSK